MVISIRSLLLLHKLWTETNPVRRMVELHQKCLDGSQHGHSDRPTATLQAGMLCVWHRSITASIRCFSSLCFSSSSGVIAPPGSLTMHDHAVASSLVVLHWTIFGSSHSLFLVRVSQILMLPIFPASNRPPIRTDCLLSAKYITLAYSNEISTCHWHVDMHCCL